LELQPIARLEAQTELVAHRAGDPIFVGYARDCGEAHPGDAAHHIEDDADSLNALDRSDIRRSVIL
jgi:hypothetical protein